MIELVPIFNKLDNNKCEIVLTGDFNINLLKVNQQPIFNEFVDTITSHSFYPHITLPTRLSEKSGSLIDNLFCKLTYNLIDTSACILTSNISDHFPHLLSININHTQTPFNKYIYVNNISSDSLNNFKTEIRSANLNEKNSADLTSDPNTNYRIIENVLTKAKQLIPQESKI